MGVVGSTHDLEEAAEDRHLAVNALVFLILIFIICGIRVIPSIIVNHCAVSSCGAVTIGCRVFRVRRVSVVVNDFVILFSLVFAVFANAIISLVLILILVSMILRIGVVSNWHSVIWNRFALITRVLDNNLSIMISLVNLLLDFISCGIDGEEGAGEIDSWSDLEPEIYFWIPSDDPHNIFIVVVEFLVVLLALEKLLSTLPASFLQTPLFYLHSFVKAHYDIDNDLRIIFDFFSTSDYCLREI